MTVFKLLNNKNWIIIVSIAAGAVLFTGGLLTYQISNHSNAQSQLEKLNIGGYGVIKAYHADGTLFATWEGHNTLSFVAKNALALCISGLGTTPQGFGTCTSLATQISIIDFTGGVENFEAAKPSTVSATPAGCITNTPQNCSGWTDVATFDTEITKPVSITTLQTLNAPGSGVTGISAFDELNVNPAISLSPGDRLVVTITFTVP